MSDVEQFCRDKDMVDSTDLMKRGALVAQDPANFEALEELHQDEKEALRFEAAHRWKHPPRLFFTIILCSIGAAVQGWDQTGSNGANLSFPKVYLNRRLYSNRDANIVGRNLASAKARHQELRIRYATIGWSVW